MNSSTPSGWRRADEPSERNITVLLKLAGKVWLGYFGGQSWWSVSEYDGGKPTKLRIEVTGWMHLDEAARILDGVSCPPVID